MQTVFKPYKTVCSGLRNPNVTIKLPNHGIYNIYRIYLRDWSSTKSINLSLKMNHQFFLAPLRDRIYTEPQLLQRSGEPVLYKRRTIFDAKQRNGRATFKQRSDSATLSHQRKLSSPKCVL